MWNRITKDTIQDGIWYMTCIQRYGVVSNVQKMMYKNGLWWCDNGMYVYYTPTHFKIIGD